MTVLRCGKQRKHTRTLLRLACRPLSGELLGGWNWSKFAACKHVLKESDQFVVDQAVRRKNLATIEQKMIARKVRHASPRFFNQQNARGGIPGVQIKLPKRL